MRSLPYIALLGMIPASFLDDLMKEIEKWFGIPLHSQMKKTLREADGPVLEKRKRGAYLKINNP